MNDSSSERESKGEARAVFLSSALPAFVIYWLTLAPTVTPEDSGELITAAYTLGVAHPPGYPLWCLLGKLFTFIPAGTIAWRVNLLSAVLGALSVGVLALLALRFTRSFSVSVVAALLFSVSRDFWSQCVIAEVYTLNVLLFLLLLFFVLRFEDTFKTRWLYLAAFTLGTGLTNHSTFLPLVPLFFGWVFLRHPVLFRYPVLILNLAGAFLLALSLLLYLSMRSATDPVMDWGNPESFSALLDHFLRRQYTESEAPRARTVLGQLVLLRHFLETFATQFTAPVAALALLGALENRKRERFTYRLLLGLFLLTSYGFIWLLNYPPDRENLYLTRVFFLPANAIGALWIGMGIKVAAGWFRERLRAWPRSASVLLHAAAVAVVSAPLFLHSGQNDLSRFYLAEDWGRNIFSCLAPKSIIVPSSDHSTFPLLYLQAVEGHRPDVMIADKYGYIDDQTLRDLFQGEISPRVAPPFGGEALEKQRYLVEHSGRPVYFTAKGRLHALPAHELRSHGLIFLAAKKGEPPNEQAEDRLWATMKFRPGSLEREPGDFAADLILADYHYARARRALMFSKEKEALLALAESERYGRGIREILNNLGGALAEAGKPEPALPYFTRALAVDPDYDLATGNLANALFSLKRYREGLPWFDRVLARNPGNVLARLGKARGHKESGQPTEAYFAYRRLFNLDPWNSAVREESEELARGLFGKDSSLAKFEAPSRGQASAGDEWGEDGPDAHNHTLENPPVPWAGGMPEAGPAWPFAGFDGPR